MNRETLYYSLRTEGVDDFSDCETCYENELRLLRLFGLYDKNLGLETKQILFNDELITKTVIAVIR